MLLFALLVLIANRITLTADEPAYVASGYGLLARGREAFPLLEQRGFTPLLIALEAWPLYSANPNFPVEQIPGWAENHALFAENFRLAWPSLQPDSLLARLPTILLSLILAAIVFRWAKDLWGTRAGLLSLGLLLFDPLLLAHGGLANSDTGAVALGTAALYVTWRWIKRPGWRFALAAGILLGLTMLAKVSGLLWAAASGLMVLVCLARRPDSRKDLLRQSVLAAGVSFLLLWAGYGFEWGAISLVPWPVPAPSYWASLRYLHNYSDVYFALGFHKQGGWWWYFPAAFLIKNPLPLLIGLAAGLPLLLRRAVTQRIVPAMAIFPVLYTGVAMWQGLNIGYRFMLPVHPFLYLLAAAGLEQWTRQWPAAPLRWCFIGALVALGVWYVIGTARIFPYEISFFNELVGGPDGGYRYLTDSNVDWGQANDVKQAYLRENPSVQPHPPAALLHPAPGRYMIGASPLEGAGITDPNAYEWFRHRQPRAILQHSLLVYDVPPDPLGWITQCNQPGAPLDSLAIAQGIGSSVLRSINFACSTAWLYPGGANAPGIVALHHALIQEPRLCLPSFLACPLAPIDPFVARHLATSSVSYEQASNGRLPAFVLYETNPGSVALPPPTTVMAASASAQSTGANAEAVMTPVALDGPLMFLGAAAYRDNQAIDVETWWRVTGTDGGRPFSIAAHFLSADGTTQTIADGLGVQPAFMQAGDVIVQRHRYSNHPAGANISLLTGAYWLDTLERWKIVVAPGADALLVQLAAPG